MFKIFLSLLLISIVTATDKYGNGYDDDVISYLYATNGYNSLVRPTTIVPFDIGISYRQLVSLDEKTSTLTSALYLTLQWNDYRLQWNSTDFNGITEIVLSATLVKLLFYFERNLR